MKDTPCWTSNRFSVLSECTLEAEIHDKLPITDIKTPQVVSEIPPHIYILSASPRPHTQVCIELLTLDGERNYTTHALLDSGASGMFIDQEFVKAKGLQTTPLPHPVPVYNVDGTLNHAGSIQSTCKLKTQYKDHSEYAVFAICGLGKRLPGY